MELEVIRTSEATFGIVDRRVTETFAQSLRFAFNASTPHWHDCCFQTLVTRRTLRIGIASTKEMRFLALGMTFL